MRGHAWGRGGSEGMHGGEGVEWGGVRGHARGEGGGMHGGEGVGGVWGHT